MFFGFRESDSLYNTEKRIFSNVQVAYDLVPALKRELQEPGHVTNEVR